VKYTPYMGHVHGVLYLMEKKELKKLSKVEGGYQLVDIEVGVVSVQVAGEGRVMQQWATDHPTPIVGLGMVTCVVCWGWTPSLLVCCAGPIFRGEAVAG
jgi:hypothetical protein